MCRKKIKRIHDKYPFFESIFLFILGNAMGFVCNMLAGEIATKSDVNGWRWIDSHFFWVSISLLIIATVYYAMFSSYSINKSIQSQMHDEDKLKSVLVVEITKTIKSPDVPCERKLELFDLTMNSLARRR